MKKQFVSETIKERQQQRIRLNIGLMGLIAKNTTATYDKASGPWDLSVAKEKNPTKQAKLTANTHVR